MKSTLNKKTMLHRRQFHRRLALSTGSFIAAANLGLAAPKKASRYVDMHTHLGQTWNSTETLSAEQLLRWMDAHDIVQAIVLPLVSPESSSYPLTADFVLAQTRDHRDRLIPFCSIDPRTSYKGGHQGLVVRPNARLVDLDPVAWRADQAVLPVAVRAAGQGLAITMVCQADPVRQRRPSRTPPVEHLDGVPVR